MRSMVEGAHLVAARNDTANNPIEITKHVTSGNSHHVKTFFSKYRVTNGISSWLIGTIMCLSIHLDDQTVAEAGEVGGDPPHRKLRPKLQPIRSPPERLQ